MHVSVVKLSYKGEVRYGPLNWLYNSGNFWGLQKSCQSVTSSAGAPQLDSSNSLKPSNHQVHNTGVPDNVSPSAAGHTQELFLFLGTTLHRSVSMEILCSHHLAMSCRQELHHGHILEQQTNQPNFFLCFLGYLALIGSNCAVHAGFGTMLWSITLMNN